MFPALSRHPLARDITVVLTVKTAVIILAAVFLFPHDRQPIVNSDVVAQKLFGLNDTAVPK